MMSSLRRLALWPLLAASVLPALAAIKLASPFTDHMVLQRGQPVPIWGACSTAGVGRRTA